MGKRSALLICLLPTLVATAAASAATILSAQKIPITGAHGMTIVGDRIILSDTFKSLDPIVSSLYEFNGREFSRIESYGDALSGITATATGYLICDLNRSVVYQTDKHFQVRAMWQVAQPWVAKTDETGTIYVLSNTGRFLRLGADGHTQVLISDLDAPFDFEFSPISRGVWITEQGQQNGRVSLWQMNKKLKLQRSLDANYAWKNPEGLLYFEKSVWVLDTELGHLVRVEPDGSTQLILKDLGVPILIKEFKKRLLVYSNNYEGCSAILKIDPKSKQK